MRRSPRRGRREGQVPDKTLHLPAAKCQAVIGDEFFLLQHLLPGAALAAGRGGQQIAVVQDRVPLKVAGQTERRPRYQRGVQFDVFVDIVSCVLTALGLEELIATACELWQEIGPGALRGQIWDVTRLFQMAGFLLSSANDSLECLKLDAVLGMKTLDDAPEARRQVAVADRIAAVFVPTVIAIIIVTAAESFSIVSTPLATIKSTFLRFIYLLIILSLVLILMF